MNCWSIRACAANTAPDSLEEAFGYIEEAKSRTLMDQMLQPVYSSDRRQRTERSGSPHAQSARRTELVLQPD